MSNKKKILIVALCALAVAAGFLVYTLSGVVSYRNKVKNTVITGIDLSSVKDGVYTGEYDVGLIYAKVSVTVESGRMISIDIIEHSNDRGESAERIAGDMVAQQKTMVDAVAGATNSSTVLMKAVENALESK